jgi:hypothetical protein
VILIVVFEDFIKGDNVKKVGVVSKHECGHQKNSAAPYFGLTRL